MPKGGDLRKEILRECHAAGHPRRTLALIARGDYWPKMELVAEIEGINQNLFCFLKTANR